MKIQTTPVLRLLTDYSHSQTIYRLHTASLKLPPDYLNSQKNISILRPLQYSDHSQFLNYSQNIPILRLQTTTTQTTPNLLIFSDSSNSQVNQDYSLFNTTLTPIILRPHNFFILPDHLNF